MGRCMKWTELDLFRNVCPSICEFSALIINYYFALYIVHLTVVDLYLSSKDVDRDEAADLDSHQDTFSASNTMPKFSSQISPYLLNSCGLNLIKKDLRWGERVSLPFKRSLGVWSGSKLSLSLLNFYKLLDLWETWIWGISCTFILRLFRLVGGEGRVPHCRSRSTLSVEMFHILLNVYLLYNNTCGPCPKCYSCVYSVLTPWLLKWISPCIKKLILNF